MSYHDLPQAILTHLAFTLVSVLFGLILGVVLGILLSRRPKLSKFVLPVLSVFNTIPGIVFVGLLFIWLGMQPATVLIALSIYAMFPILKNTYAGLVSVDPQYIEAARAAGMTPISACIRLKFPGAAYHHRRSANVHHLHGQLDCPGCNDRAGWFGHVHLHWNQRQ